MRSKEKTIDIKGFLTDLFGTVQVEVEEIKDEVISRWRQENKKVLDISESNIKALEDMIRIPDKKGKVSTNKKMKGLVVEKQNRTNTKERIVDEIQRSVEKERDN